MFFSISFLIFFIAYNNLCCLLLSDSLHSCYSLGFILSFLLVLQIIIGMLLSWIFFNCYLSNNWYYIIFIFDWDFGFIIRSFHVVLTSCIYLVLYIHLSNVILFFLLFDSHFLVWFIGFLLFFCIILIAFIGYVLPCTMMSYWGLTVFSNILATVPIIGGWLCYWVWGCEFINDYSLLNLHSLHICLPFILLFLVLAHFFCLHFYMSSDGFFDSFVFYVERVAFCLWYFNSDFSLLFIIFLIFIYYFLINWYFVFHEESWIIVDVLNTADNILPEWFFLSFFGFINSVPDKFTGLFLLFIHFFFLFIYCLYCYLMLLYVSSSSIWYSFFTIFIYFIVLISLLALYVIMCYPIWLEIQFCVLSIMCIISIRFF